MKSLKTDIVELNAPIGDKAVNIGKACLYYLFYLKGQQLS